MRSRGSSLAALAVMLGACGGGAQKPAAAPLRPPSTAVATPETPQPVAGPSDCMAIEANRGLPPKSQKDRSIEEAESYASQGLKIQLESEKPTMGSSEARGLLKQAMEKYFTALAADPYNVKATYNLAAAYARIERRQCAVNLLARLVEMQSWPSAKEKVDDAANRIFGKGKKWAGQPDPDFDRMRQDERFRSVVTKF